MNHIHYFTEPIRIIAVIVCISFLSGCYSPKTYEYATIRSDFSRYICHLHDPDSTGAIDESCDLDVELTLPRAIAIALRNNPRLIAANARWKQSQSALIAAESAFYPHLNIYTEVLKGDAPSTYLFKKIDQRELPPEINFNNPGRIRNIESGIQLGMNLYSGGRDLLNKGMAETEFYIAELAIQQLRNELAALVVGAYFDCLAAGDYIRITHESVSTVQSELKLMEVRYRAGGVLKSDILSLEVRLAEAHEEVIKAENRYKMALTWLAEILGINPDQTLNLASSSLFEHDIPQDYEQGLARGISVRPELLSVRENMRRARMALDAAGAGYLPRLDLKVKYYLDDEDGAYSLSRDNWVAAAMINWDLFSGFATRAQVHKARTELEVLFAVDRQTELAVKADIKNAYFQLAEAASRLESARGSVAMAEELLELVSRQYEGGSVTITRFLEAELDLHRAKMRYTNAFYDQAKSLANAGRAIGYWISSF